MARADAESAKIEVDAPVDESSPLAPFGDRAFAVLWTATVVSNIGTWMQSAAAGWLMTSLDPAPFSVSLVQVASSLPMFLFALPAGALADIVDRRRLLIIVQVAVTILVAVFGLTVHLTWVTPTLLLTFTFMAAAAAASITPAWQAIVPQLVPRRHLPPAVALNSVGLNVSRAVGPALAGIMISAWGIASPFWVNALTTIAVIAALIWWRPREDGAKRGRVLAAATCGTPNMAYVKSLGADRVIDYKTEDVCQAVRDWSAEGVDVVLDAVGPATLPQVLDMLRSGGRLINILTVTADGDIERARNEAERRGFRKIITIIDFERARESRREITNLIDGGLVHVPAIDVLPLEDAARAHQMIDTGHIRGKLLLKVAELSA